jgi:hypothetical protein
MQGKPDGICLSENASASATSILLATCLDALEARRRASPRRRTKILTIATESAPPCSR